MAKKNATKAKNPTTPQSGPTSTTNEPHAVVKLLLARMESHPEEFISETRRWDNIIEAIRTLGTEEERRLIDYKLGRLALDEAHKEMLDELLNGEERRAEKERAENERLQAARQAQQLAQQQRQQWGLLGQIPGVAAHGNNPYSDNTYVAAQQQMIYEMHKEEMARVKEGLARTKKGKVGLSMLGKLRKELGLL